MKKIIKQIAKEYNVNPYALKDVIKKSVHNTKKVTRREVLEVLYINAPDLMFCRRDKVSGMVEYLDINLTLKLCKALSSEV